MTHLVDGGWTASDFVGVANPGCSVGAAGSVPGSRMVMGASRERASPMSLVFRRPGWGVAAGVSVTVRASFLADEPITFMGHGEGGGVSVDVGDGQLGPWVTALTRNNTLEVTFERDGAGRTELPWTVALQGADEAVSAMGNCLAAHGITTAGPPFRDEAGVRAPGLFGRYPAGAAYRGAKVMPDFAGRDREFADYRTVIRQGIAEGANFGGRYKVIQVGCGTDCRFDFIADVSTGQVHGFPVTSENLQMLTLEHTLSSTAVRASWMPDLVSGNRCMWQDFVFAEGVFLALGPAAVGTCPLY